MLMCGWCFAMLRVNLITAKTYSYKNEVKIVKYNFAILLF